MANQTLTSRFSVGTATIVSNASSGLYPASNSTFDDATATRLGLKQYLNNTAYNGGVTLTISPSTGTVKRGVLIPYQMQDGTWRLKFNIHITYSSSGSQTFTINSVTGNTTSGLSQAFTCNSAGVVAPTSADCGHFDSGNNTFYANIASGSTQSVCSGDIELGSKPTWAY